MKRICCVLVFCCLSAFGGYSWRGLMLDEGRFFFGKQVVKETLDRMAACGLNVFHWHLTEDQGWRLEIKRFPELTRIGAVRPGSPKVHTENDSDGKNYGPFFYTQDDVREILQYATARNITIVPEIELPGHVKALLAAHPEFSCTGKVGPKDLIAMGVQDDVLCAGNDAAIRFLEQVFDEVCALFPGEVIHIGGDECPKKRWKACPKCQARIKSLGLKDEKDLQAWVTHHFANYLAAKGRRAMGWDEILEGEGCPTNVIVQSWRTVSSHRREGVAELPAIAAARRGFDVVMSPIDRTYFSIPAGPDDPGEYRRPVSKYSSYITPESVRAFRPEEGFPEELRKHILGAECCCWSEGTRTGSILHQKTWPRAAIFAKAIGACAGLSQYDVVIAGGTRKAVTAAENSRRAGRSVCVLAPRNYLGEEVAGTLACVEEGLTPLQVKQALDRRLLDCGADFLTGTYILSVESNEVHCASVCGEFTLGCKEFLDCRIETPQSCFSKVARIVIAGTSPSAPGMSVQALPGDYTTVVTNRIKEDGDGRVHVVAGKAWRCELELPFTVTDALGLVRAELYAREKTWVPDLLDGADELIPLEARSCGSSASAPSCVADVVVVGGGVAGVPAAIAAARAGAKTILVEALHQLGGMGTAGGIGQYWQGCRDGITAEYDQRIRNLKPAVHGVGKREAWRRMAQESGILILWGCAVYGVEKDGARITAVKVATDYGPLRIAARTVVDATGNANVAAVAGAPVQFLEAGPLAVQGSGVSGRPLGVGYENTDWGYVDDSSVRDRTRFLACGRMGAHGIWDVSQLVGSRERRRIVAELVLTDTDMATGRKFSDVVVRTRSNFDSHGPTIDDLGLLPEPGPWLIEGVVPYRALLPKGIENMLVAGLGLGATRDALPIVRMQPDVQNTGYAAGMAAAMAAEVGGACRRVDVKALQRRLVGERRLTEDVLAWTEREVSDVELSRAVQSIADNYRGAALVLSERVRAIPLLKEALAAEDGIVEKFRFAHVLGILGADEGADLLADWVEGKIDVPEPNLVKKSAYAKRFDYRSSILIALGRTKHPRAVEALRKFVVKLSNRENFFMHRAVCWAAEACGSRDLGMLLRQKAASYPLAVVQEGIRPKGGYSPRNHFMTEEEFAALKALDLATSVYRLIGDDSLLRPWLNDSREVYRLQVKRILDLSHD